MKKIFLLLIPALILILINFRFNNGEVLYFLNWGEYISTDVEDGVDLIKKFEDENNCTVKMDVVGSSEEMYLKIKSRTTRYDVAIPGDYVIEKMAKNDMIYKLDKEQIPNLWDETYGYDIFNPTLTEIRRNSTFSDSEEYCVPYFWGAYAMIYNTRPGKEYIGETVRENGFKALFDRSLFGGNANKVRIGMYDVPRFCSTAYLIANGYTDINTTDEDDFDGLINAISGAKFDEWGNDMLKKMISNDELDICLTQLGDFFDQLYQTGLANEAENPDDPEPAYFNCFVPSDSVAFYDAMVIPNTAQNKSLAYKFINFMLDPENALINADYVGYSPTLRSVIDTYNSDEGYADYVSEYPMFLAPVTSPTVQTFADIKYLNDGKTRYNIFLRELVNKGRAK